MWYTSPSRRRPCLWRLLLLFLTFAHSAMGSGQFQRFANEPSPQTAVIGSTVVLPCRIINMAGELQWTRDGFGLGNERQLYAFKRYQMIGSNEEGDYSLQISPVTLEDDSVFQCQATGNLDIPGIRSQEAKLTVYVPPGSPEVTGPVVKTTAGSAVQLTCLSRGGKPAAELQWLDGEGRMVTDGVQYTTQMVEDGHRQDAKSVLSFIASSQLHNKMLTCTASNPALNQPLRAKVSLEVRYPPTVTITHDQDGYKEGETATLTCLAIANPQKVEYRWYHAGMAVQENRGSSQLVIPNVTRDANMQDITCEASNEVGTSKKITRLSVHYGPSFRVPPTDEYGELGENVTLRCQVDSLPDPTIVWIHQQTQAIVGKGPAVTVEVTNNAVGTYLCISKVNGFPELSGTVGVFLKGPPDVRAEKVQWGKQGDTVLVECLIASASSRSAFVTWTHHGKKVELEPGRYEVVKDSTSRGLRHTLVIKNARMEDFGTYNCSVYNEYGSDIEEILLNKKKTLPLILILCVVCGGMVFLLVIALVVIWCAKRSQAKHRGFHSGCDRSDKQITLQLNDHNSTANESDLKVEIDQRTVSSMSNKESDIWERDMEHPATPTYLTSNNPYLYPSAFSGMPFQINGHLPINDQSFSNYVDHGSLVCTSSPTQGYNTSPVGLGGLVSSSQHTMYPSFSDYDPALRMSPVQHQPLDSLHARFSPQLSNGIGPCSFNFSSGTLPLPVHKRRASNVATNTDTIPRMGIPPGHSQYIMPPRTQANQGALATHV